MQIRGFEIDYFKIDGMSQYGFIISGFRFMDRVEIVKGAKWFNHRFWQSL